MTTMVDVDRHYAHTVAERCARAAFWGALTFVQKRDWTRKGRIRVYGSKSRHPYWITPGEECNIWPQHEPGGYCVIFSEGWHAPTYDLWLAQKLLIENDEGHFRARAVYGPNWRRPVGVPGPDTCPRRPPRGPLSL